MTGSLRDRKREENNFKSHQKMQTYRNAAWDFILQIM